MHRDALLRMLQDKKIIMQEWPAPASGQFLVVDAWGCCAEIVEARSPEEAASRWADTIEEQGGFGGGEYPQDDVVYAINHHGEVSAISLSTDWEPQIYTSPGRLPALPASVVWC